VSGGTKDYSAVLIVRITAGREDRRRTWSLWISRKLQKEKARRVGPVRDETFLYLVDGFPGGINLRSCGEAKVFQNSM
jgi:hypothetical protein